MLTTALINNMSDAVSTNRPDSMIEGRILERIEQNRQRHLLQFWDDLSPVEQAAFADQLSTLDWNLVERLLATFESCQGAESDRVRHVAPPVHVIRQPTSEAETEAWSHARQLGEEVLRSGKVAVILLAGGQGTRLGFPHPKGMFPIGPVSGKSLFELFAEQITAMSLKFGCSIPYLIMTSDETHDETVAFFQKNAYFGLNPQNVFFFQQGLVPSFDARTGELLLESKGRVRTNPDGHGGLLAALQNEGLFELLQTQGIEYLFLHQVDNPLTRICDPVFIGLHVKHDSDVSTKVISKKDSTEKVGIAAAVNGRTSIIEYSDLPVELATEQDDSGRLRYWAGNTAIHVFNRKFLQRIANSEANLSWHRAIKRIPHVDKLGREIDPKMENGAKFERFLFDTLPFADTALIVETMREEEFAPLKNFAGEFSADYVRQQMVRISTSWLNQAGVNVPDDLCVEISPRFALSAEDVISRSEELTHLTFEHPLYLEPQHPQVTNNATC